ncbi:LytTr DNA-binding domain-containing protein [Desulfotomaculum arcticum]|uniref:LytTr DNA-binding domain-containing protein n=1 Tax=Desulfotruncus arcticus DSM 17038 TaxID=1121424 RepID=A0A1I2SYH8_9FIRM|nr:LytTR family DNA-binding domain-containing protein [Desulfotruncus arcticus]SFG56979.1 LytTr DNA-binding domain-containing protein [Desulfotomaculum arcticum] [Desulfotruncus arcticus DSM 17038]
MNITGFSCAECDNIICFKQGYEKIFLLKDEIIMFATSDRRVDIYTLRGKHTVSASLSEIEKKLNDAGFFRSHQSYLINIKMVKKVSNKADKRYIEFHNTRETALISKSNERKLYEMVKII